MAAENLKDFNNQWILFGLLFFSMMAFTVYFFANNGTVGLGDTESKFSSGQSGMQTKLYNVENDSNILLNISSQSNPEVSYQGSRDSVGTSYTMTGSSKGFFEHSKIFMKWVLTGTMGELLLSIFAGMFGMTSVYFINKWIRAGF